MLLIRDSNLVNWLKTYRMPFPIRIYFLSWTMLLYLDFVSLTFGFMHISCIFNERLTLKYYKVNFGDKRDFFVSYNGICILNNGQSYPINTLKHTCSISKEFHIRIYSHNSTKVLLSPSPLSLFLSLHGCDVCTI